VADQQGVEVEHIVQDACSDDGTQDWLPHDRRVQAYIEKDSGMYDAVNRGYRRATGDILAYLNCDEQYLPGALAAVQKYFEEHPQVEVLLAGTIVTDSDGQYICHRQALVPHPQGGWFRFSALTASIFIRRQVIHERGFFFDTDWRVVGDMHWIMAMRRAGVPMAALDCFTSIFADTGDNLCLSPSAKREMELMDNQIPGWVKKTKPLWILHYQLCRILGGHFNLKPTPYALYTKANADRRITIDVSHPTPIWQSRP
jgi:glycosyltransferase involved in cell wall biosynthesis